MTPSPPRTRWLARAGNGLTVSKSRNRRNPVASVGSVSGNASTESVIPATSSMTIAPGSFLPRTRSVRCAAHVPASVTTTKKTTRPVPEKGTSQRTSTVRALPTVPGATGTHPAPPAVAMISATRSAGVTRLGALADQLVPLDLDDRHAREPAGLEAAAAEIDHTVDLRRLASGAALEGERRILARAVHEHVRDRPDERLVALPRDPVLEVLDNRRALGRHLGGNLVGEPGRRRSVLGRVCEDAEPVEAHLVEELEEILKRRLRFAREADQHRRADGEPRDRLAKRGDDLLHAPGGDGPAHGAQDAVVPVLHGQVEVGDDPRALPLRDEPVADVRGVEVHRTDPGHTRLAERQEQVADVPAAGQIATVGQRVLRDQNRFLDAARGERFDLADDVRERTAPVTAAELRDRAEGAAHVAPLGDLHVGVRYLRGEEARCRRVIEVARRRRGRPVVAVRRLTDEVHDAREVRGAEDTVHFGHLPKDLAAVALREAAGDDEASAAPPLLQSRQLQDRRDRLLPRAVDEGARVDDEALGVLGPVGEREPGLGEHAEHQLGVDLVLGAAEGREMDLHVGGPVYLGSSEGASTAPSFTDSPRTRLARRAVTPTRSRGRPTARRSSRSRRSDSPCARRSPRRRPAPDRSRRSSAPRSHRRRTRRARGPPAPARCRTT